MRHCVMRKSPRFVYNTAAVGSSRSARGRGSYRYPHTYPSSSTSNTFPTQNSSSYSSPKKRGRSPDPETSAPITTDPSAAVGEEDDQMYIDDIDDATANAALDVFNLTQTMQFTDVPQSVGEDAHKRGGIPITVNGAAKQVVDSKDTREDLQDRLCILSGENKILRSEKERIMEELRRTKEQMVAMQTKFVSQQKAMEQEVRRQKETQNTSMAFMRQEVQTLQTKLETKVAAHSMTTQSKGLSVANDVQFPSTESFIPLSQTTAKQIRTVHVGSKKPPLSTPLSHSHKIPSTQPEAKKLKASPPQEADRSNKVGGVEPSTPPGKDHVVNSLDIPVELSGAQLLRLLMHKELLTIPVVDRVTDLHQLAHPPEHCRQDQSSGEQPPGLLSLLQPPNPVNTTPSCYTSSGVNISKGPPITQPLPSHLKPVSSIIKSTSTPLYRKAALRALHGSPGSSLSTSHGESSDSDSKCANSPTRENSLPSFDIPLSALSCISLQESIASLLKSSDCLSLTSIQPQMPHYSLENTTMKSVDPSSPDSGVSLLPLMESIITKYYQAQLTKHHNSSHVATSSTMDHACVERGYHNNLSDPTSSSSSSSFSLHSSYSMNSSNHQDTVTPVEHLCPIVENQRQHVLQALLIVQILATYSKPVRQALLSRPPQFCMDSEEKEGTSESSDDADDLTKMNVDKPLEQATMRVFTAECLDDNLSERVLVSSKTNEKQNHHWGTPCSPSTRPAEACCQYTGSLFDILIQLVTAPWVQDQKQRGGLDVVLSVMDILIIVAQECSTNVLERYLSLITSNGLVSLVLKEHCQLTHKVLLLLTHISRTPAIIKQLCNDSNTCLLGHCYALYSHFPLSSPEEQFRLHLQLTELMFQVSLVEGSSTVLFESECCSDMLLKSMLSLLVDILTQLERQTTSSSSSSCSPSGHGYVLAGELFSLLHFIVLQDRLFHEHRTDCDHTYLYCITAGHRFFKDTPLGDTLRDLLEAESMYVEDSEGEGTKKESYIYHEP